MGVGGHNVRLVLLGKPKFETTLDEIANGR